MNQLPEDSIVGPISRDQQLELLRNKLTGHKSFGFCRGNFTESPNSLIVKDRPPTEVIRLWEERSKHVGTMLTMLAKFRRNGWTVAYEELQKALNGEHVIEGETIPLEQTTPVTALLFEPEIIFPLIAWALTHQLDDLKDFTLKRRDTGLRDPILGSLYEKLPDLEESLAAWENDTNFSKHNRFNGLMYGFSVFDRWIKPMESVLPHRAYHSTLLRLFPCGQNQVIAGAHCFGLLLVGDEQDKVLGAIPRARQHEVATWRFDIPTILLRKMQGGGEGSNFSLCLHPEDEHGRWKKMHPTLVSRGFQHGLGAVMLPKRTQWGWKTDEVHRGYLLPERGVLPEDGRLRMRFDLYNHYDDGIH